MTTTQLVEPAAPSAAPAHPAVIGQIARTWLGFAAMGAGMVHFALVITAPPALAAVLLLLGLAECGWGIATFARERLIAPRIARLGALLPVVLWSLLVVAATLLDAPALAASLTLLPMAVATALDLFVAVVLSRVLQRADADLRPRAAVAPSAGRYLIGLMAGATVVAALVTPALAGTEAGRLAQPHGQHDADFVPAPADDPSLDGLFLPEHGAH